MLKKKKKLLILHIKQAEFLKIPHVPTTKFIHYFMPLHFFTLCCIFSFSPLLIPIIFIQPGLIYISYINGLVSHILPKECTGIFYCILSYSFALFLYNFFFLIYHNFYIFLSLSVLESLAHCLLTSSQQACLLVVIPSQSLHIYFFFL